MSKKSKRKKPPVINSQPPSKIIFTFETVKMLREALHLVDEAFLRNTHPLPNIELAFETTLNLKTKLMNMIEQEDWETETPLDYNEIHILYASIHMYLVQLTFTKNNALLTPCLRLCKQFSILVEQADRRQIT